MCVAILHDLVVAVDMLIVDMVIVLIVMVVVVVAAAAVFFFICMIIHDDVGFSRHNVIVRGVDLRTLGNRGSFRQHVETCHHKSTDAALTLVRTCASVGVWHHPGHPDGLARCCRVERKRDRE